MDFTTVQKNLEERGFAVSTFATAKEAADYLNAQIDRSSVSFGGSMTLSQMGLFESLGAHNTMYSHWNVPEGMNAEEVLRNASTCENYLLSANGLAETGEIINIDGTGNRVSSSLYGHKKVWFVVGSNKLAPTYDEALLGLYWPKPSPSTSLASQTMKKASGSSSLIKRLIITASLLCTAHSSSGRSSPV